MTDYISREAAIGAIEKYADCLQMINWKENPGAPYKAYALNWCINTLRDLPSAQPAADVAPVVHAWWEMIAKGETGYSAGDFRCSECSRPCKCWTLTDYCPNCGAKMDGGGRDA